MLKSKGALKVEITKSQIGSRSWKALTILPIFFLLTLNSDAQEWATPFSSPRSLELKNAVKKIATDSRIVGLGECTHYTQQCYTLKREIIATLTESGFRGLVLEVDFGQALIWDDYVTNGIGDLDEIVSSSGWFTYRTEEFKSVLKMIHDYNVNANNKCRIFGMEMTAVNHSINWMLDYVKRSRIESDEIKILLAKEMPSVAFQEHTFQQTNHYWNLSHESGKFLKHHQAMLIERCGKREYEIARKTADIFRQYATYVSQSDPSLKSEFRDQFSSRNVIWCLNSLGPNEKVIVWAHNGHVTKNALANYDVLGNHLSRWFGEEYYSIGFTMGEGEFKAFSEDGFRTRKISATHEPSITLTLKQHDSDFVFVGIRDGLKQDSTSESYLRKELLIQRDFGESFRSDWPQLVPINLSLSYDAMIYIDRGKLPTSIEWSR